LTCDLQVLQDAKLRCPSGVTSGRRHSQLYRRRWSGPRNCCQLYSANFLRWKHCHCLKLMTFRSTLYKAKLQQKKRKLCF